MFDVEDKDPATLWHRRAALVGMYAWDGKDIAEMTEQEIEAAFVGLRYSGISYTWPD